MSNGSTDNEKLLNRFHMRRKMYGYFCAYCRIDLTFETFSLDHVYPTDLGGSNAAENKVACCKTCNGLKLNMLLDEFKMAIIYFTQGGV